MSKGEIYLIPLPIHNLEEFNISSLPTINIGTRQKGRVRASNIIDCKCSYEEIMNAFKIFKSKKFLANLKNLNNPYKINKTSFKIYSILKKRLKKIQNKKSFYDI